MCIRDNKRQEKDRLFLKKTKDYVARMGNRLGSVEAAGRGIAHVFAEIYKDLYSSGNDETKDNQSDETRLESTRDYANDDTKNDGGRRLSQKKGRSST